jgi:hypothetical protein
MVSASGTLGEQTTENTHAKTALTDLAALLQTSWRKALGLAV